MWRASQSRNLSGDCWNSLPEFEPGMFGAGVVPTRRIELHEPRIEGHCVRTLPGQQVSAAVGPFDRKIVGNIRRLKEMAEGQHVNQDGVLGENKIIQTFLLKNLTRLGGRAVQNLGYSIG